MSSTDIKITRSFRMTPEAVALIQQATEATGAAQGDVIEECIKAAIGQVTERFLRERQAQIESRLARPVRPVGRPRKSAPEHTARPAKLTKRQQS
jgi:hypothetical protein